MILNLIQGESRIRRFLRGRVAVRNHGSLRRRRGDVRGWRLIGRVRSANVSGLRDLLPKLAVAVGCTGLFCRWSGGFGFGGFGDDLLLRDVRWRKMTAWAMRA